MQQQHLAEFNHWLYRWNNYQQHLAHYWQGRYHSLYKDVHIEGYGKVNKRSTGKSKKAKVGGKFNAGGDKVEMKWQMRYQERESCDIIFESANCHLLHIICADTFPHHHGAVCDFKEEHGHTNVPKEYTFKYSPVSTKKCTSLIYFVCDMTCFN